MNFRQVLAYIALGAVLTGGLVWVTSLTIRPRQVNKIKISRFENPAVVANSALLSLERELQGHSLLLLGVGIGQPDIPSIVLKWIEVNRDSSSAFPVVIVDEEVDRLFPELRSVGGERLGVRQDLARLAAGLQRYQQSGIRVMVLMPAPFAVPSLENSPAFHLKEAGFKPLSLLFVGFPRRRTDESEVAIPCDVGPRDQTGTGKLGCDILTTARLQYRKFFSPGDLVGLLNQTGPSDFLFLLAREP